MNAPVTLKSAEPMRTGEAESQLIEQLRCGDVAAFEMIIRRESPRLLAVARRMLGNDEDANDAVQDGLISAFKSCANFEGHSQISTWLHRIIVNAALMKLRSRRRRNECAIDDLLPRFLEDGHRMDVRAPWQPMPEDALDQEETRAALHRNLERLPDEYREVIMLRDIEELSTEHTAAMLGITAGAVKTRLHRARQALRTLLEDEWCQPGA
jgi:RNA polymerase sigma-70 factor (ECF subfamily)